MEQGTHFVDLARYIAGDLLGDENNSKQGSTTSTMKNLTVHAIMGNNELWNLSKIYPEVELDTIPKEWRNPILTTAQWVSETGAIVSFTHGAHLHHQKLSCSVHLMW